MKPQDTVNIQNQFRVTTRGHTVKLKNHVCNSIKNHNMLGGDKVCAQTLECGGSVERSRVHRLEHLEPSVVFFNLFFREGGDTGRDTSIRCLLYTLQLRTEPHNLAHALTRSQLATFRFAGRRPANRVALVRAAQDS